MQRTEKEAVVAELAERLRASESLIVADYRGLTNVELEGLRTKLREHGARFQVVKNTLTRRASEAAGVDAIMALLEGPTAIAFVESDGDPAAVAKALSETAKSTKILTLRGGVLSGRTMTEADIEVLAKLPPVDVLKGQLVGVIIAPVTQLLGLLVAPVRDLVGLIDARIEQLGGTSAETEVLAGDTPEPADEMSAASADEEESDEAAQSESAATSGEADLPETEPDTDA